MEKVNLTQTTYNLPSTQKTVNYAYPKAERMLIKLVLDDSNITKNLREFINPAELQDGRLQKILELLLIWDKE